MTGVTRDRQSFRTRYLNPLIGSGMRKLGQASRGRNFLLNSILKCGGGHYPVQERGPCIACKLPLGVAMPRQMKALANTAITNVRLQIMTPTKLRSTGTRCLSTQRYWRQSRCLLPVYRILSKRMWAFDGVE